MTTAKTIDAHAEGGPIRLVIDGFPAPRGRTMRDKQDWVSRHADQLRRQLLLEPRGHTGLAGAVLTEPVSPGSHAGLIFMHADGYGALSGHAVVAVTTIALERGLLMPGGDGRTVVYDTVAGTIRARATVQASGRVERVAFVNVPAFVLRAGATVKTARRPLRADVAYGGVFHAIVDSEAVGVPIDVHHLPELARAGVEIARAVEATESPVHPLDARIGGIAGTVFTGPAADDRCDLRNVTVYGNGLVDRSPGGTGTSAVMAVLDAMGLLRDEADFTQEGLLGSRLRSRVVGRTTVGDLPAIVTEVEGSAWITGEHMLWMAEDDPFRGGTRL